MALIIHLSDLHFGPKFNPHLADLILADIIATKPDLTIISGDFTMRGRESEYESAQAYLTRIPPPILTIPGNHDQPLYLRGLYERFTKPWARYIHYINPEVDAKFVGAGLFVLGLNDNHPILPGGIWSAKQRRWLDVEFQTAPPDACRVFVMHHQLHWGGKLRPIGRWFPTRTLNWLARRNVELVLNGHTHVPITVATPQGIIIAQTGTAMSTRVRYGHGNTYNRIEVTPDTIAVDIMGYEEQTDRFTVRAQSAFPRRRPTPAGEEQLP